MEKVKRKKQTEPIMAVLKTMEVGASHAYPWARMNTVKSIVSQVQVTTGKSFKAKLDRPDIIVTRIS